MKRLDLGMRVANKYRICVYDSETGKLKKEINFHNTVTDWWKNNIANNFLTGGRRSESYVILGDGEGTHTSADVQLFHPIFNTSFSFYGRQLEHTAGDSFMSTKISLTLNETQANGNLTEIAIAYGVSGGQPSGPYAIATFSDSEGHPISIEKTDTDTLILDITLEFSLDVSNLPDNVLVNLLAFYNNQPYSSGPMLETRTDITKMPTTSVEIAHSSYPSYYFYGTILAWLLQITDFSSCLSLNTDKSYGYGGNQSPIRINNLSVSSSVIDDKHVYRFSASDVVLSSAGNLADPAEIYQILSLGFLINSVSLCINLPDHDIFPPTELEFEITGDGSETDFNLPVPFLMKDRGCTVTVNGVEMSPSEYDWYGVNYQTVQAWGLNDWSKITDFSTYASSSWGTNYGLATSVWFDSGWNGIGNNFINYDFKEPITVDCVGRLSHVGVYGTTIIQYKENESDDWTTVKSWTTSDTTVGIERLETPITARYWRVEPRIRNASGLVNTQKTPFPLFGLYDKVTKPTIHFHNPLPVDQVVRIKAWTEYPCKSEDWIYKTISLDIAKGVVEE